MITSVSSEEVIKEEKPMKKRRIAAIDVGTTKVCTIMADTDGSSLRILESV